MKWCGYMNMWCSDMDDEDIEMAGCDGECGCCDDCEDSNEDTDMILEEKQIIAAEARKLISMLENCDDDRFVDLIINCVATADTYLIEEERL